MPRGMSGNSITPNCEPAMSKLSSSSSSAWPSITRVSMLSPSSRARRASSSSIAGERSVASTRAPEARRRDAERAAAGGDVEEPHARAEPGAAQPLVAQPHLRRGVGPVVAGRDRVPGGSSQRLQEGVGLLDVRDVARVLDDVQRPTEPARSRPRRGRAGRSGRGGPRAASPGPRALQAGDRLRAGARSAAHRPLDMRHARTRERVGAERGEPLRVLRARAVEVEERPAIERSALRSVGRSANRIATTRSPSGIR